jgi:hypothetical protein
MYALALRPLAIKLGPWLGRAAKSSPGLVAKLADTLRAGGAKVGSTIGEIVTWVKQNPGNAALLTMTASTIPELANSIKELFDADAPDHDELVAAVDRVRKQSELSREQLDKAVKSLVSASSASEKLNLNIAENIVDQKIAIAVLGWAIGFYGSVDAAERAHKLHQAYFEMPFNDVHAGFAVYDLNPSKVERTIRELEAS